MNSDELQHDKLVFLFQELQKNMNERFDAADVKHDRILTLMDGLYEKADIDDTERVALSTQVDRHEDWISQASRKVGLQYEPGA